ncbi:MAG: universal stress protein [Bacilli bacterium]
MSKVWNILLASDGSAGSLQAADWLEANFTTATAQVTVVTVVHTSLGAGQAVYTVDPSAFTQLIEVVEANAKQAAQRTQERMPRLQPQWVTRAGGDIARVILDVAAERHTDVIAVGRRGHGTWASVLLGSVSLRLLTHSSIPVWVIPGNGEATHPLEVS